ncbi:MAG: S1 RNA-binding domain-containing protein [Peptococcaceae bacterium]|jgi:S1 RNA binding domain protein|nr:S1 RNA-binding domain-containing protein [Peptococcaceae bacterium]
MAVVVGSILEGVVKGITVFGAFVELPGGVTGLVHISEVADAYVKDVKDYLKEQDRVKVKVINVDPKGKIGLSIKQVGAQEGGPAVAAEKPAVPVRPPARPFRKEVRPLRPVQPETFEDKLAKFIKESDQKQSEFRRSTDAKRGGRGSGRG